MEENHVQGENFGFSKPVICELKLILHRTWLILFFLFNMLSYFGMNLSCIAYQTCGRGILALSSILYGLYLNQGEVANDFYALLYHMVYLSYISLAEYIIFCIKNIYLNRMKMLKEYFTQ